MILHDYKLIQIVKLVEKDYAMLSLYLTKLWVLKLRFAT